MINTKNNGSKIRERLEKLSALRKIKPVDMTTLSQQVAVGIIFFIVVVPMTFKFPTDVAASFAPMCFRSSGKVSK